MESSAVGHGGLRTQPARSEGEEFHLSDISKAVEVLVSSGVVASSFCASLAQTAGKGAHDRYIGPCNTIK